MVRAVALLDLDAFYTQVERERLGLDEDVPLAVQQWNSLIAVSYSARALGVSRFDKPEGARAKGVQLEHTEVVNGKVSLERYRRASTRVLACVTQAIGGRRPLSLSARQLTNATSILLLLLLLWYRRSQLKN